jgi:serine protease Do
MRNLKFGVFCLGLAMAIGTVVASLAAQDRFERPRHDVMILEGRGAQLGVRVSDVDPKATTGGVKIDEVSQDSPAERAGLKAGDIVVEFDAERVRSARHFTRLVQETPPGRTVKVALLRDGKRQTVDATPESDRMTMNFGPEMDRAMREAERGMREFRFDMPNFDFRFDPRDRDDREPRRFEYRLPDEYRNFRVPAPGSEFPGASRGRLGVSIQPLTRELEEYFGATNGGALVSSVRQDSAASKAGIKPGDVIVSVNGRSVRDADDLVNELEDIDGEAAIVVLRDKKQMTLKADLVRR